eukprot:GILI01004550.1.p1 GENE.GILI01004550.1~~GILI01004550.1.p1  ORF type:complete len:120 (+),score=51.31 GILI01004550.1:58-417(+)
MRRVFVQSAAPLTRAFAASAVCRTGAKSNDPTYEDDRWLEAQFTEKAKTPEERYAAQKQLEIMKTMLTKVRSETDEKVKKAVSQQQADLHSKSADRDKKIDDLNAQIAKLLETVAELKK